MREDMDMGVLLNVKRCCEQSIRYSFARVPLGSRLNFGRLACPHLGGFERGHLIKAVRIAVEQNPKGMLER